MDTIDIGSSNSYNNTKKKASRQTTDTAVLLTILTVFLLIGVKVFTPSPNNNNNSYVQRVLEEVMEDDVYSSRSCDEIYTVTSPYTEERCLFARTCNAHQGIFLPFVFCQESTTRWCTMLSPLLFLYLVLLFRLLGSTAEEYFSPSLEMFSVKLGLPPRFAGVSLLALGNGAADVSATYNAIVSNPTTGYQMSLGALTGAGMFVSTVVAGLVIVTAGGVHCRGALVRDVIMFLLTLAVVFGILQGGVVGKGAITVFFAMYLVFALVVLIADVYHRAVVLPRIKEIKEHRERERQLKEGRKAAEAAGIALEDLATKEEVQREIGLSVGRKSGSSSEAKMASLEMQMEKTNNNGEDQEYGCSVIVCGDDFDEKTSFQKRALDRVLMALSNYNEEDDDRRCDGHAYSNGWGVEGDGGSERPVVLHGANGILAKNNRANEPNLDTPFLSSPYSAMDGSTQLLLSDSVCTTSGMRGLSAASWNAAWWDGLMELQIHFCDMWSNIWDDKDNSILDKLLLVFELPFTFLRKVTVPIPCDGYYCRAMVALSIALSPLWIWFYAKKEHDVDLFSIFGGFPFAPVFLLIAFAIATAFMRLAPSVDGTLSLWVAVPIAFYGFAIAATWIDTIADQLVQLLGFLGIILGIPSSIMGLTVLAWGNSMGDLSANITMTRKGLANMAITACFAGPVFNILMGLGLGFWALAEKTGNAEMSVVLTPSINVGFFFLLCNCFLVLVSGVVIHQGSVPKNYGYVALSLYILYVFCSLLFHLKSSHNDN